MFLSTPTAAALAAAGLAPAFRPEVPVGSSALKGWYPLLDSVQTREVAAAAASALCRADDRVLVAVPASGGVLGWGVLATTLAPDA